MQEQYREYISGNKLLVISSTQEVVATKNISPTNWKVGQWRRGSNVLVKRSNVKWNILLLTEEAAKKMSGSIFTTKLLRMKIEYMDPRKIRVTLDKVPIYISEEAFFFQYGNVEDVSPFIGKESIANGDIVLQMTVTLKNHFDILGSLICRRYNIFVIVEEQNPYY